MSPDVNCNENKSDENTIIASRSVLAHIATIGNDFAIKTSHSIKFSSLRSIDQLFFFCWISFSGDRVAVGCLSHRCCVRFRLQNEEIGVEPAVSAAHCLQ